LDHALAVEAVHPRALDRRLAFERHASAVKKAIAAARVVDDDADVVPIS